MVFFSGLVIIRASPLHFDIVIDLNVRATSPNVLKYAFSLNYLTLKRRRISIQTEKKEKEKKKNTKKMGGARTLNLRTREE